jgi:lipocalin
MYRSNEDDRNDGECVLNEFLLRSDYLIRVENSQQDPHTLQRESLIGRARWPDPPVGELEVKYEAFSPWESYKILETDYSNYAVAYSCYTRFGIWNYDHLWVMTRQPAEVGTKLWNAYKKVAV